uniref:protein-serine/threonine phosphatase n=1 Tax=Chlamydomonas leiostraca TaxID=1034604 RepID=A0A7S0R8D2_9CHLO|mmetsp:Transcript_16002/g.39839  ORF Transcript_16002/g.39839 Transcript_16002/m.39839 type:complete len:723 (+) Transcript_16002:103-2271(+)
MPSTKETTLWSKWKKKLGLSSGKKSKAPPNTQQSISSDDTPAATPNNSSPHNAPRGSDEKSDKLVPPTGAGDGAVGPTGEPVFAGKSIIGHRFTMEDQWCAVAHLLSIPRSWVSGFSEQLPPPPQQDPSASGAASPAPQALASKPHSIDGASPEERVSLHFFAVYDGHGGADVAKHCSKKLHEHLKAIVAEAEAAPPPAPQSATEHLKSSASAQAAGSEEAAAGTALECSTASESTPAAQSEEQARASPPPASEAAAAAAAAGAAAAASSQGLPERSSPQGAGDPAPDPSHDPAQAAAAAAAGGAAAPSPSTCSASTAHTGTSGSATNVSSSTGTAAQAALTPASATTPTANSTVSTPFNGATANMGAALAALPVQSLEASLIKAFLQVDAELGAERLAHEMGTTAVVAMLSAQHLWVANCGDSRAVLCREGGAIAMSSDHKATRNDEVVRVEAAGGYVWWERVMGELAVSRAIGDHCLRPFVIAEPEVTRVARRPEDRLLLLASDGLWDVFRNDEACATALAKFNEEVAKGGSAKACVKKVASDLAKSAMRRGSRDNITVVVVDIRLAPPTARGSSAGKPSQGGNHSAAAEGHGNAPAGSAEEQEQAQGQTAAVGIARVNEQGEVEAKATHTTVAHIPHATPAAPAASSNNGNGSPGHQPSSAPATPSSAAAPSPQNLSPAPSPPSPLGGAAAKAVKSKASSCFKSSASATKSSTNLTGQT